MIIKSKNYSLLIIIIVLISLCFLILFCVSFTFTKKISSILVKNEYYKYVIVNNTVHKYLKNNKIKDNNSKYPITKVLYNDKEMDLQYKYITSKNNLFYYYVDLKDDKQIYENKPELIYFMISGLSIFEYIKEG